MAGPEKPNSGIIFIRTDLKENNQIIPHVNNVCSAVLCTTISNEHGVKVSTLKHGNKYFGKTGFTSIHKRKQNTLSISFIEDNFDKLVENEVIVKEKSDFVFDSTLHGYDKILGRGKFSKKLTIICNEISANAKKAVEATGGKVTVLNPSEDEFEEASE